MPAFSYPEGQFDIAVERLAASGRETQADAENRARRLGTVLREHVRLMNQNKHYWTPPSVQPGATEHDNFTDITDGAAQTWVTDRVQATLHINVDQRHEALYGTPDWLQKCNGGSLVLEQLPLPHTSYSTRPDGEVSQVDLSLTDSLGADPPTGTGDLAVAYYAETGAPLCGQETETVIGALSLMHISTYSI